MPGYALQLSLRGLADYFDGRAQELAHLSLDRPLRDTRLLLVAATRECFDRGRSPSGVAWAPLKRPSARRGGPSAKPLRDTGVLMASFTAQGRGHVDRRTPSGIVWGSNLPRAAWHQEGTRTIPARPMIGFTPQLSARIEAVFADWLEKSVL